MHISSYSTAGFVDRDLRRALEAIAEAGFPQVEILGQAPHVTAPPGEQDTREIRRVLDSLGFSGLTVHAPLGVHVLGATEEQWRRRTVSIFATFLRFTAAIGGSALVIHPVPNPRFVPDADAPDIVQWIGEAVGRSLDDLVPVAEDEGVRILLENLPYDCPYPLLDVGALRPLVDAYPAKALALVVDTGHAWTRKRDPASEILTAGARLGGLHLQDVDGANPQDNHWLPTHGDLDWRAIRDALARVGYGGPWTFEVIHPRGGETPEALAAACRQIARNWESEESEAVAVPLK